MSDTDAKIAELRRLHSESTQGEWEVDQLDPARLDAFLVARKDVLFSAAAHNHLLAILDELEASRKRLAAMIEHRWVVSESPVPDATGKWICGYPSLGWPGCIKGSGPTLEAAIDRSIAGLEGRT